MTPLKPRKPAPLALKQSGVGFSPKFTEPHLLRRRGGKAECHRMWSGGGNTRPVPHLAIVAWNVVTNGVGAFSSSSLAVVHAVFGVAVLARGRGVGTARTAGQQTGFGPNTQRVSRYGGDSWKKNGHVLEGGSDVDGKLELGQGCVVGCWECVCVLDPRAAGQTNKTKKPNLAHSSIARPPPGGRGRRGARSWWCVVRLYGSDAVEKDDSCAVLPHEKNV